jgi:hypothetical protein
MLVNQTQIFASFTRFRTEVRLRLRSRLRKTSRITSIHETVRFHCGRVVENPRQ